MALNGSLLTRSSNDPKEWNLCPGTTIVNHMSTAACLSPPDPVLIPLLRISLVSVMPFNGPELHEILQFNLQFVWSSTSFNCDQHWLVLHYSYLLFHSRVGHDDRFHI